MFINGQNYEALSPAFVDAMVGDAERTRMFGGVGADSILEFVMIWTGK